MAKDDSKKPKTKTSAASASKSHRKVFDVVPPGKSPAAPNSRSVIVGHKPPVKDDQFVPAPGTSSRVAGDPSEKRPLLDSHKKIDLKPGGGEGETREAKSAQSTPEIAEPATPTGPEENKEGKPKTVSSTSAPKPSAISVSDDSAAVPSTAPLVTAASHRVATARPADSVTSEHLADLAVEQVVETETFETPEQSAASDVVQPAPADNHQAEASAESKPVIGAKAGDKPREGGPDLDSHVATAAGSPEPASRDSRQSPTTDDLLAETSAPDLEPQKVIVSTHHRHWGVGKTLFVIFLILVVAAVALNFLLDAGVIETEVDIPYTDLIGEANF